MLAKKRTKTLSICYMLVLTAFATMTANVGATGLPPIADAGGPYSATECSSVLLNADGSFDPEGAPLTYRWLIEGEWIPNGYNPYLECLWLDDFQGEITLEVSDGDLTATDTALVTIENIPPLINYTQGPTLVEIGSPVPIAVNFYDGLPDPRGFVASLDTYTVNFSWDDGAYSDLYLGAEEYWANDSHVYYEAGVYHIIVTIVDDDGGTAQAEWFVVVYDPTIDTGFVTGGGWIIAEPGSYPADPTLTGKCTFGFVSKYKKGHNTPDGNTEFQFHAATMNFHSGSYEWLIVAGPKALFKGTGTINGEGNYGFMLTAIDGQITGGGGVDKLRMKIWDKENNDLIVFDNNLGEPNGADPATALGGGQITIHKA